MRAILGRLAELGAKRDAVLCQVDTYFVCGRPGWRLKLREMPQGAELISYRRADVEGDRVSAYTRAPVSDPRPTRVGLGDALGRRVRVWKRRELFWVEHTRIHLDVVAGLGTFVELETLVDRVGDLQRAQAECTEVLGALGLETAETIGGSYVDLMVEND